LHITLLIDAPPIFFVFYFLSPVTSSGSATKNFSRATTMGEYYNQGHDHEQVIIDKAASYIQLHNGLHMPMIGFGTAALTEGGYTAVAHAVTHGYQLFDTASDTGPWYHTEKTIGKLTKDYELNRKDLFVTSKLHPQDFGPTTSIKAFQQSLENLDSDYIDLYLLHYPECWGDLCSKKPEGTWKDAWKVLEDLYDAGKVKSIGVSNFPLNQLEELMKFASIKPHVVQTWFDPFHQDWELISYCRKNHIVFQAYSPLGNQWQKPKHPLLNDAIIASIAEKYKKSPVQVTLRWMLQEAIPSLPRSNNPKHIEENIDIFSFSLTESEVRRMRDLNGKISRGG